MSTSLNWVFDQQAPPRSNSPSLWVPLTLIAGTPETWPSLACTATQNLPDGVVFTLEDEFAVIKLCRGKHGEDITVAANALYDQALEFLTAKQLQPFRVWNFVPAINHGQGDAERYRRFCQGRADALERFEIGNSMLPAASAVGCLQDQPLVCLFLASRHRPTHVENPRQVSAYDYPRTYGPKSPRFARGTILNRRLYLSGTASICGHQSRHEGNLAAQVAETCKNIEMLVEHADCGQYRPEHLRVYLRYSQELAQVEKLLKVQFPGANICYLHADICRKELLVEIEGTFGLV